MYFGGANHLQNALDTGGVSLSLSENDDKNRPKYSQVDEMQRPQTELSCKLPEAEEMGSRPP